MRKIVKRPDTIIVRGVPSRWFAETRVSSKPSTLVTHTIFSALGKIRCAFVFSDFVWLIIKYLLFADCVVHAFVSMGYWLHTNELLL